MNFGKHELKKELRSQSSNAARQKNRARVVSFKIFIFAVLAIAAIGIFTGLGMIHGILKSTPSLDELDTSPHATATTIYDVEGNEIQQLVMAGSNRELVTYKEIPEDLVNAFVAIEDERFWTHNGIDPRGIARAFLRAVTHGGLTEGASTITQQLIKNSVFEGGSETNMGDRIRRKIQEQYLAVQLEKKKSKTEIMEDYLNTINLGASTLGVEAASQRYFGKHVSDLTLSECATIAAITQNPSRYNPITHPEENQKRRDIVLDYMYEQGKISAADRDFAKKDDVYARIQTVDEKHSEETSVYSFFVDEVIVNVLKDLEAAGYSDTEARTLLYSGGLKIYTTQDPKLQEIVDEEISDPSNYADIVKYSFTYSLVVSHSDESTDKYSEADVKRWLRESDAEAQLLFDSEDEINQCLKNFKKSIMNSRDSIESEYIDITLQPQGSVVLMEQDTGYVRAVNGLRGEKEASLSLNRATDTTRQPGSTFKVLTAFAPALDSAGQTLGSVYYDSPYEFADKTFNNWWPTGEYVGYSSIRDGIVYSMNIIALKCMMNTVTPELGYQYALDFGITSLVENETNAKTGKTTTDIGATLCLGGITYGVSNLELTAAYAAIANKGVYTKPVYYTKIVDRSGKVILNNKPETHTVIKESTAWLLTNAMEDVCELSYLYGDQNIRSSAPQAKVEGLPTAGKSGTTTANNDVWFVGYTPYYTLGVWEGFDDNGYITTGENVKSMWNKIMTRATEGLPAKEFYASPSNIESATICKKSGKLAIPGVCDHDPGGNMAYNEFFAKGTTPTEVCDHHTIVTACAVSNQLAGQFCPAALKQSRVYRLITEENASGTTFDSQYVLPASLRGQYCGIHTAEWLLQSQEESSRAEQESIEAESRAKESSIAAEESAAEESNHNHTPGDHSTVVPGINIPNLFEPH